MGQKIAQLPFGSRNGRSNGEDGLERAKGWGVLLYSRVYNISTTETSGDCNLTVKTDPLN